MNPPAGRVLVVEDDDAMRALLADEIEAAGHSVATASSGAQALAHLATHVADVVVTDLEMPGMRGNEVLRLIRARDPDLPVVVITAFGSIESAVEIVKAGAFHYVAKPFRMDQLVTTIEGALRERRLRLENAALRTAASGPAPLVAASPAMRRVLAVVERAAAADSPVIFLGESGTGKEILTRALHDRGRRARGPFLALNCSAIPETLLESQLFGHRRGAFTDAREDRRGLFQEAGGGTLFLDEIGDMALPLQAKLLRVLEEKAVRPLGATASVHVDVRVVAATHRDLDALIAAGRFRQDLYFRLNVITVRIPPLRERPEDLEPLVRVLVEKHRRRLGRAACTVAPAAMELMRRHRWPGNVRELENALERALVLGRDDVIGPHDLPESVTDASFVMAAPDEDRPADTVRSIAGRPLEAVERDHILATLRGVHGNKAAAARILGVDRKTLYRKLGGYRTGPSA